MQQITGLLTLLILSGFFTQAATAASPRGTPAGGGGDQNGQRYIAQINALKQQVAAQAGELQQLNDQLTETRENLDLRERELEKTADSRDKLRDRLDQAIERIKRTDERLEQTRKKLSGARYQISNLSAHKLDLEELDQLQKQQLLLCEDKNIALYQANLEMADRYKNKGMGTSLLQREPITGLKQVEIENILEEYRDKLDQQIYQTPQAAITLPEEPGVVKF